MKIQSFDFTDAGARGVATSNLAGNGTIDWILAIDDSDPGPDKSCNTVDETGTFTFSTGSISIRSLHRDCDFGGPRIWTVFAVTGGTGTFAGASGWGVESAPDGFQYDGTISY